MRYSRFVPPKHKPGPEREEPLPKNRNEAKYLLGAQILGELARKDHNLKNPYRCQQYHAAWQKGNHVPRVLLAPLSQMSKKKPKSIKGKQFGAHRRLREE